MESAHLPRLALREFFLPEDVSSRTRVNFEVCLLALNTRILLTFLLLLNGFLNILDSNLYI